MEKSMYDDSKRVDISNLELTEFLFELHGTGRYDSVRYHMKRTENGALFSARFWKDYFSEINMESIPINQSYLDEFSSKVKAKGGVDYIMCSSPQKEDEEKQASWTYVLTWSDGTETGAGEARLELMSDFLNIIDRINNKVDGEYQLVGAGYSFSHMAMNSGVNISLSMVEGGVHFSKRYFGNLYGINCEIYIDELLDVSVLKEIEAEVRNAREVEKQKALSNQGHGNLSPGMVYDMPTSSLTLTWEKDISGTQKPFSVDPESLNAAMTRLYTQNTNKIETVSGEVGKSVRRCMGVYEKLFESNGIPFPQGAKSAYLMGFAMNNPSDVLCDEVKVYLDELFNRYRESGKGIWNLNLIVLRHNRESKKNRLEKLLMQLKRHEAYGVNPLEILDLIIRVEKKGAISGITMADIVDFIIEYDHMGMEPLGLADAIIRKFEKGDSPGITKYRVFLSTPTNEFIEERAEIETFIQMLNKYTVPEGIFVETMSSEDMSGMAEEYKNGQYSRAIKESDLFVILSNENIGMYSIEECDIVKEAARATGHPRYIAYFDYEKEYIIGESPVLTKLEEALNRYCYLLYNASSVKLGIIVELARQYGDLFNLNISNGNLILNGNIIMDLEDLSHFALNEDRHKLKASSGELNAGISGREVDPDAIKTCPNAKSDIEILNENILNQIKYMYLNVSGEERIKGAVSRLGNSNKQSYLLFECGRTHEAASLVCTREFLEEFWRNPCKLDAWVYAGETRQKLGMLKITVDYPYKDEELVDVYEAAVFTAFSNYIMKETTVEYIEYLKQKGDEVKIEEYIKKIEHPEEGRDRFISRLVETRLINMDLHRKLLRDDEAMNYFNQAIEIYDGLSDELKKIAAPSMAKGYISTGLACCVQACCEDNNAITEGYYLKALEIYKWLDKKENPRIKWLGLYNTYIHLIRLLASSGCYDERVEKYFQEAFLQFEQLAEDDFRASIYLVKLYDQRAIYYHTIDDNEQRIESLKKSLSICEMLSNENKDVFEQMAAYGQYKIALTYDELGREAEAEEAYLRAIKIWESLSKTNISAFVPEIEEVRERLVKLRK